MDKEKIHAQLQLFLLGRDTKMPAVQQKDFVKALVTIYLKINIDNLDGDQRTELYKAVNALLETYKEKNPSQGEQKILKVWMREKIHKYMSSIVRKEKEQSDSANQSEWLVIDETGSEGSSSISGGEASQSPEKVTKTVENSDNVSSTKKTNSLGIEVISVEILKNAIEPKKNETDLKITNVCTLNASTEPETPNLTNIQKAVTNDEKNIPRKDKTKECLSSKSSLEQKKVINDEKSSKILEIEKTKEFSSAKCPLETPQKSFNWNNYKIPKKYGNNSEKVAEKTVGNPNATEHPTLATPSVSSASDQDILKEMMTNKVSERIQISGSIDKIPKKIKDRRSTINLSGSEKTMKDVSASKLNTPGTSKKIKERRSTCAPDNDVASTKSETDNSFKKIKDRRSSIDPCKTKSEMEDSSTSNPKEKSSKSTGNNTSESVGKTTDNVKSQNTLDSWCLKEAKLPVENIRNEEQDVQISKQDSTSKKSDSDAKPKKKNKKKSKKRNRLVSSSSVSDIESSENCTAESVLPTIESSDDFENEITDNTKLAETPSHDTESKVEKTSGSTDKIPKKIKERRSTINLSGSDKAMQDVSASKLNTPGTSKKIKERRSTCAPDEGVATTKSETDNTFKKIQDRRSSIVPCKTKSEMEDSSTSKSIENEITDDTKVAETPSHDTESKVEETSGSTDKISKKIKERRSTIDISSSEKAMQDVSASKLNTPGTSKKIKERRSTCALFEGVATTKSETDNTFKKIQDRRSSIVPCKTKSEMEDSSTSKSTGKSTSVSVREAVDNVKGQKVISDVDTTDDYAENRKIIRKRINTLDSWCFKEAKLPVENIRNEEQDSTSKESDSETKPKKKNKKKSKKRNRRISSSSESDIESSENCTAESVLPTIESSDDSEIEITDNIKVTETPSHDTESKVEETPKHTSWDVTKFHDMKFMKSHCLSINGTQNQVRNYFFQMNPTTNIVSFEKGSSVDIVTRMYDLKELLYWPGVGVKLELPGITITRRCESNFHSELVGQNASEIPSEYMKVNKNEVFYFHSSRAQKNLDDLKPDIELSYNLVVTYLEIIMECLTVTNYANGSEIELILCTMLKDLKMISRCFQNRAYSYFLSDRPYYRVFRQDVELGSNTDLLHLREFCNPEIIFEITQCKFEALKQVDFDQFMSCFTTILIEKDADAIEDFNAMLSKGYILYCADCIKNNRHTGKFTSSKRICEISNHIGPYCTTDFNCVKCGFYADEAELAKTNWYHECE